MVYWYTRDVYSFLRQLCLLGACMWNNLFLFVFPIFFLVFLRFITLRFSVYLNRWRGEEDGKGFYEFKRKDPWNLQLKFRFSASWKIKSDTVFHRLTLSPSFLVCGQRRVLHKCLPSPSTKCQNKGRAKPKAFDSINNIDILLLLLCLRAGSQELRQWFNDSFLLSIVHSFANNPKAQSSRFLELWWDFLREL